MPRAKRQSDINYNIRRKAQRRIASLERKAETAKTAKERRAAQSQASQLSKQLSQTYQQGKKGKALSRLSESLQGFTPARKRLNTLFKGALRTAGAGGYSRASSIAGEYGLTGKEGTDLFYIVTQRAGRAAARRIACNASWRHTAKAIWRAFIGGFSRKTPISWKS